MSLKKWDAVEMWMNYIFNGEKFIYPQFTALSKPDINGWMLVRWNDLWVSKK